MMEYLDYGDERFSKYRENAKVCGFKQFDNFRFHFLQGSRSTASALYMTLEEFEICIDKTLELNLSYKDFCAELDIDSTKDVNIGFYDIYIESHEQMQKIKSKSWNELYENDFNI